VFAWREPRNYARESISVPEGQHRSEDVFVSRPARELDRRSLVKAGAILSAAGMVAVGAPVFAQDATPSAEETGQEGTEGAATPEAAALPTIPPEIEQYANDWPMAQHDYEATRHAVGSTIDSSNVGELGVAWELPLDSGSPFGAITSNPIVLGDRIYLIDNAANIQAINRDSGEVIWRMDNNVATLGPNGVAVGYGKLVGVLGDTAEVLTLDAETGEELWRFQLANHNALGITMAPFIYDGYVIVSTEPGGNSKGTYEGGANGVVYCLDIETGLTIWTWDTVEEDLWGNFRVNSGGGLWYPPSVDLETGVLFMGIGNAGPFPGTEEYPNGASRPGMNNYANCLVALDPTQGKVLWYYNVKPRDMYDHDNQQTPVLATVQIGGADADLAFTSGKHGYVAAVHRSSGQVAWHRPVGKHQNDGLLELPEEPIEVFPGILGGVESPMAFANGVLYVPALNFSSMTSSTEMSFGGFDGSGYSTATTNLVAIDGATGETIWDVEIPAGTAGPGPVVANDVVFIGTLDGIVRAYNTADGTEVWRVQTSAGLNAPFAVAGDMLLVPAGSFIAASADSPDPLPGVNAALIAFQLGATGTVTMGEAAASGDASPAAEEGGDGSSVSVTAIDIAFEQTELSILADTDVTITLTNNGVLQHDLVIEGTDFATPLLNGGESADLVANLPAGEYVYFCSVAGHREAGMVGTLIVG
jgi:glucose dehydrogenase/plastocyanin